MTRIKGFDYKQPFFYMVTLKKLPGIAAFSQIAGDLGGSPSAASHHPDCLAYNEITRAFSQVIRHFHETWRGIWPIECFMIMPDHIHLLIGLKKVDRQIPLGSYVHRLMRALNEAYWHTIAPPAAGAPHPPAAGPPGSFIFERDWHDWIVKRDGQMKTFTRYIRENPKRAWLRQCNRQFFEMVRKISFLGHEWYAYGNCALLELPVLVPIKGHRSAKRSDAEWKKLVAAAKRIGPACAGISTFLSPLEKECGNAIAKAGGKCIVLCPEGFGERWHPPRAKERFCAEGRMLFLSRWTATRHGQLTNTELYRRCHVMGDLVEAALSPPEKKEDTDEDAPTASSGPGAPAAGE